MAAASVLDTVTWRESVLVGTLREARDPFSIASYEAWNRLRANWHRPSALPAELLRRMERAAPSP